jgi:hypothetical protein
LFCPSCATIGCYKAQSNILYNHPKLAFKKKTSSNRCPFTSVGIVVIGDQVNCADANDDINKKQKVNFQLAIVFTEKIKHFSIQTVLK